MLITQCAYLIYQARMKLMWERPLSDDQRLVIRKPSDHGGVIILIKIMIRGDECGALGAVVVSVGEGDDGTSQPTVPDSQDSNHHQQSHHHQEH